MVIQHLIGVIAKKILAHNEKSSGIQIKAEITALGGLARERQAEWQPLIEEILKEGDSVGGIVECCCTNVPVGLGEPFFDSLESQISHLLFSIPGVRGVEFGDGFAAAGMRGSEHNDPIADAEGKTARNGAGGINGEADSMDQILPFA